MTDRYDVFLSYSRNDLEAATLLLDQLKRAGPKAASGAIGECTPESTARRYTRYARAHPADTNLRPMSTPLGE